MGLDAVTTDSDNFRTQIFEILHIDRKTTLVGTSRIIVFG
jgi:hypothetical protein